MSTNTYENRRLPLKHLSIRVPWHDNGWNGTVCRDPKGNASCLVLDRIRETRDDEEEIEMAGELLSELPIEKWPVCVDERGTFMSPFEIIRKISHPYSSTSDYHKHILPTDFRLSPFSAAAIPFRWASRKYAWELAKNYELNADPEHEPKEPKWLNHSNWVQSHLSQKAILNSFFSAIEPEKSLCFFYAKETPLAEDERRVIVGVGRVQNVGNLVEYRYSKSGGLRSYIWDRAVQHSIRPNFEDGFILPYQTIFELTEEDPELDPADFVAFAPEDRRIEFSFASEHVTHDGAIAGLLSCKAAIEKAKSLVDGPWDRVLKWIDSRLAELWKLRGPYPGLGVALTAFGVAHGSFLAYELASRVDENEDPWPLVDQIFNDPSLLPKELARLITPTLQAKWNSINNKKPDRLALLKIIARLELTLEQAIRFYVKEEREDNDIDCSDEDILNNPYLFYERDRSSYDPISVWTVNRGIFPAPVIRENHPIPEPSAVNDPTDPRRVSALIINTLEQAARQGHTLMACRNVVTTIRDLAIEPECPVDSDLFDVISDNLSPVICSCKLKNGSPAYQLDRLEEVGELIRSTIEKRHKGKRHTFNVDWRQLLDEKLGNFDPEDEDEELAREEKTEALKELTESRVSVLIGPAGTGKTTLLSVICNEPSIRNAGILLLAPTGKARVRLQQSTNIETKTIAQFLLPLDRYDEVTFEYYVLGSDRIDAGKTVIVDECSMLTEEQLGALLDALKGVERLILVGDPRQLPPIGAGRPFVDIVTRLTPENVDGLFPKVGKGYTELTVRRRQEGEDREDLQLAEWFSGRPMGPAEDEIINSILTEDNIGHIRFVTWNDAEDLHQCLLDVLAEELELDGIDDTIGFELGLGGVQSGNNVYFNRGAGKYIEDWQILSPVCGMSHGISDINRLIQRTFRSGTIDFATSWYRKIPKPMGPEQIVYGDKVINVRNHRRYKVYPDSIEDEDGKEILPLNYVANGEIGIAVGQFKPKSATWRGKPWLLKVEFSSQLGFEYDFSARDFGEENNPKLELAYAITVHKAQGSEFDMCLLVLPNPCRLLSRELLYTALTRQRDRIVIFYQGERSDILKYSSFYYSETAQRLTNIFSDPAPIEVKDRFLEENLIHRSGKDEPMRSKSEVIIADSLAEADVEYEYEQTLVIDGHTRYPDFIIEDYDTGITYYWEHCGMLQNREYKRRWERKLAWYKEQQIIPLEDGGGERGTLIITNDDPHGGISSKEIKELIKEIWG